jgi:hypothetical protein
MTHKILTKNKKMPTTYKVELNFDKDFVENLVGELGDYNINVDITDDPEKIKIKFFNF